MSLLEDVFLEDEAGEAQELERVIEGDEYDDRPQTPNSNENSEKEDEAEEDKRRVDHTAKAKRMVKNPRFILNPARLTGPRGIQVIPEHFKDFKFKGKGHEREDLDYILKNLEHWAYRLYPKFKFDDCLKKIETLGKKRPVMVHLHKIRTDQFMSEETVVQRDSSEDEAAPAQEDDEFDKLLQQQIELARATPAPGSVRKEFNTPVVHRSPLSVPKATLSPSISDEQKERMIRNRKLAEERRLARLKMNNTINKTTSNEGESKETEPVTDKGMTNLNSNVVNQGDNDAVRKHKTNVIDSSDDVNVPVTEVHAVKDDDVTVGRKHIRYNVIDSSDDENGVVAVNESITVDVHSTVEKNMGADNSDTENRQLEVNSEININSITDEIETDNYSNENIEKVLDLEHNDPEKVKATLSNQEDFESETCKISEEKISTAESVISPDEIIENKKDEMPDMSLQSKETAKDVEKASNEKNIVNDMDVEHNESETMKDTLSNREEFESETCKIDEEKTTNAESVVSPNKIIDNNEQKILNISTGALKDVEKDIDKDEVADIMDVDFSDDF